jgi:hypothetical protein
MISCYLYLGPIPGFPLDVSFLRPTFAAIVFAIGLGALRVGSWAAILAFPCALFLAFYLKVLTAARAVPLEHGAATSLMPHFSWVDLLLPLALLNLALPLAFSTAVYTAVRRLWPNHPSERTRS